MAVGGVSASQNPAGNALALIMMKKSLDLAKVDSYNMQKLMSTIPSGSTMDIKI